jgi:rod shape-determining protein MreC
VQVERNSSYAFASIFCEPIAGVERHRFVLILDTFRDENTQLPPPLTSKEQAAQKELPLKEKEKEKTKDKPKEKIKEKEGQKNGT